MKFWYALKESWTALTSHDALNLHFPISDAFTVALWERPGRWASDAQLSTWVEELRQVALAGQEGKELPEYGVLLGTREELAQRVIVMVYDTRENPPKPVGFNALTFFDIPVGERVEPVLHLGLTFIDPGYQRQGLPGLLYGLAAFMLLFKNRLQGYWISNVTQVPAVVGLVSDNYAEVFPHYSGRTRQTWLHLVLARAIMRSHRAAFGVADDAPFEPSLQIIRDAYTGGSDHLKKRWEDAPKHRKPQVNQFCQQQLDYQRGDDVLQLGRCTVGSTLGFLRSRLPPGSPQRLLVQALMLFSLALVMPLVQWLFPQQQDFRWQRA